MRVRFAGFGAVIVDGKRYEHDVVIEHGDVVKRRKKRSKERRGALGHTPLSLAEPIPWTCRRLIVGTGAEGRLPVLPEVAEEARRRGVELVVVPTDEACRLLEGADPRETAAVLHVTC